METNNLNLGALLPIIENNGSQAVNARDLHAFLEVGRDFTNWMKDQIERCDLVENQDYEVFAEKGENPKGGRPSKEYALSINAGKEISMMSQTEKGKQARRYFIACEETLKEVAVKGYIPLQKQKETKNPPLSVEDQVYLMTSVCKELKVNKAEKRDALNRLLMQNGLPSLSFAVKETDEQTLSADILLTRHGSSLKSIHLFAIMKGMGYVEENKIPSKKNACGFSTNSILSEKGKKWGYNVPDSHTPNKMAIRLYVHMFKELLEEVNSYTE